MQLDLAGDRRTIEVTTSRLTSAGAGAGGAAGIVMLLRDVTEVWELAVKQSSAQDRDRGTKRRRSHSPV